MAPRRYEIIPRSEELGGGYRLKMYEGDLERGGGVFPSEIIEGVFSERCDQGFLDAQEEGESWIDLHNEEESL